MQKNDLVEGVIESLAFGGQGVLKTNGLTVFVPLTAAGETITCQLTKVKKNFAEGRLVDVLKKSPDRTAPLCPYFGTCGGCQLQHLSYQAQLDYKQKAVVDALERIGRIKLPFLPTIKPATPIWEYRRHITLNLLAAEKGYLYGYTANDYSFLPIDQCPIFLKDDHLVFKKLALLLSALDNRYAKRGRAYLLKTNENTFILSLDFSHLPENAHLVLTQACKEWSGWQGIILSSSKKFLSFGQITTQSEIEGLRVELRPDIFIQNNEQQSKEIYQDIVKEAKKITPIKNILDLYCGVGISSLLLDSQGLRVRGIESNALSIQIAQKNAQANDLTKAKFVTSDVNKVLNKEITQFRPELIIINPPRTGLDSEVTSLLLEHKPQHLLYVSCMPPTLARDLHLLQPYYEIATCYLYDMFPQTAHVETLVKLTRKI